MTFTWLEVIYILCIIPGIISLIFQLFFIGTDDSFDDDIVTTSFEFKFTKSVITNFLLCFGVIGYLTRFSSLSLFFAILSGCIFAYGFSYVTFYIFAFCKANENKIDIPKEGVGCITTTRILPNTIGTVNIKMNNKTYEYFAKSDKEIPIGTECRVVKLVKDTVFIEPY